MLKSILFILFLCFASNIYSQKYNIQIYNTDNGLPQNSVKDIIKDKYGFIWLTTENGIVRYDGTHFLTYKNFPISSQRFTFFYGSPKKDSIFTEGDYGTRILLHKKIPKVVHSLKRFPNLIFKDNINYFLYSSNYSYTSYPGMSFYINFKNGRYYIKENLLRYIDFATKNEKVLKFNSGKNKPKIFVINETLFHIDTDSKEVQKIEKGAIVNSYSIPLLTDKQSKIFWSRINNQVFILNKNIFYSCRYEKGQLEINSLLKMDEAKDENFISIYYDDLYKKLYLGSSTEGLKIIHISDFTTIKRPLSKSESVFYSTLPYDSSSVISPFGEIYNRNGIVSNLNFKNIVPFFMDYDQDGNIMARRNDDLMIYTKASSFTNFTSIKNFFLKDFFFDDKRYYALVAKQKNGTPDYSGRLIIYKDKSFKTISKEFFLNSEPTKCIKIDDTSILVGTLKGLYKIEIEANKIFDLSNRTELSVRNIIKSKDGNFWITTLGKGIYLIKDHHLIKMPNDEDNNISSSHTILEDDQGFFWIPTNNGLYRILESQLLQYAKNKKHQINYYRFSKDSGFNTNEFNGGSNICGNKLGNGDFVIPSLNGLVFFNPSRIKNFYPKNIYVERALIDSKEKHFTDNLQVEQNSNRIEIFIDIPYYANPDNVFLEAKIAGIPNTKWEQIGKDRKFSISNLSYGNYSFIVKMFTSDDGKFIYKKINIIIPPYFYQTLWFKIILFSIFLLLLYYMLKWRVHFLKKKNSELEAIIDIRTKNLSSTVKKLQTTKLKLHKEVEQQKKLIGTITHDITTPVKFIAITAKEILDKKEFDPQRTEKFINSIYKSSDQLYNFTVTLKEYADIYTHHRSDKTEAYFLYNLIEEKKELFNTIAENKNTLIINNVDEKTSILVSKNILSAIIHNLLDNAVKYTRDGTITIDSYSENDMIIVNINDTGNGMDEQKIEYYTRLQENIENEKLLLQKYGMGLHLVLQLLQMIESKITFKRNDPHGTTCQLMLKNKRND